MDICIQEIGMETFNVGIQTKYKWSWQKSNNVFTNTNEEGCIDLVDDGVNVIPDMAGLLVADVRAPVLDDGEMYSCLV